MHTVIIKILEDIKAQDIIIFDTSHITYLFSSIIIASGTSSRHTKALSSAICEKVKVLGKKVIGIEGEKVGEWILVDLGDVVVHIMQPVIRSYYSLEKIWGYKTITISY